MHRPTNTPRRAEPGNTQQHNEHNTNTHDKMNAREKDKELARRIAHHMGYKGTEALPIAQARTLRLAEKVLHGWAEKECNGEIRRDEETGVPVRWRNGRPAGRANNREAGALGRVAEVCKGMGLYWHHQTDPRGCALYVSGDPIGETDYTNGVACCM